MPEITTTPFFYSKADNHQAKDSNSFDKKTVGLTSAANTNSELIEARLFRLLCDSADNQPLDEGISKRLRLRLRKEGVAPRLS